MSNYKDFSLDQLAEMLQPKLQKKAHEDKALKILSQHDINATNKANPQKRSRDKENSPDPSTESKIAWQESSYKAMLRHRLGIGPELDRETQNTLSRTIRAMITHKCGLTLKETYTTYRNEGMWDEAVKGKSIVLYLNLFCLLIFY